ncbi:LysR family transcriptional regulator [Spirosoma taeanense]|uniref:LysR family transcriptional regulator n=1 Tax=Spirosoma taeanense TaxID=2735870 RepID=A0A6M5Y882_9BACT|nr:LysR substrate-binding domain-containing protein [Spirosoma taeanense]QJW89460.1 LysR family transcriptional regulator [Spirosoma taeanense]
MELRQLRYFVEIAQELHYRKAANRLFISQPALSQQIQLLEDELGVDLFVRSRRTIQRKVELTEAGKVLLREAKQILQLSQQAIEVTRQAGLEGPIRMGVFKTLLRSRILNVMNLLAERLPQAKVKLIELPSFLSVQQALLESTIDLGLTVLPLQYPQLTAVPFARGNIAVLLPQQHTLAKETSLTLAQLQNEDWVEIPPPLNPVYEAVEALCQQAGFARTIIQEVNSLELLADLVQLNKGIALIPSHFDVSQLAGVVPVPLVDSGRQAYPELDLQHVVAFLSGSRLPAVLAFGQPS